MDLHQLIFQWINFFAPAAAVSALLSLLASIVWRQRGQALSWLARFAINFIVGAGASCLAVSLFGRDGKMLGYGLLVLAVASSQWVLMRGWRH